ncbi:MAG: alpha/beta hydrolase [Planctomycetes bacterium]|nr:alpha/beta hydrolase [Planctomycetota bacterium]
MAIEVVALCLALFQQPAATAIAPALLLDQPYGEHEKQVLDLYLPAKKDFPTVVFTYGGGWHSGSGKSCTPIAEALRARGYGCALLSHRVSPPDAWPAMIEDEARAFAWVHEHVAEHGGDPKRLFLMGHSSGAQLALLLASDARQLAPYHLSPKDVAGVVGLSTPLDLVPRGGTGFGDALMGGKGAGVFGRDVETMRAASPLTYLSKDLPPLLLVVGENDFPMLAGDAESFADKANALGREVAVVLAEGKDHMGVVQSLLEERDPTARAVFEFLDHLAFPEAK